MRVQARTFVEAAAEPVVPSTSTSTSTTGSSTAAPLGLWLPPSMRPPPPPPPKLFIPDTYARPRTDAEQAYYRRLIDDVRADLDRRHAEGRDAILKRLRAQSQRDALVRKEREYVEEDGRVASAAPVDAVDPTIPAGGLRAEVPHRKQIGPTCGLYAIGMVMDAWHRRDPKNPTALVQDADLDPDPAGHRHWSFAPTTERRLLDVALEKGYTAKGEMYHGKYMARLAADFGMKGAIHHGATLDDLYRVLDRKHPAIVCYDNDRNGNPGQAGGHKAHYAVVEDYFDRGGERYLVVKHSWSRTTDRVWRAEDFLASWGQMRTTAFYGTPGDGKCGKYPELPEPSLLDLPPAGDGLASIEASLANKIIEIVPEGEPLPDGEIVLPG